MDKSIRSSGKTVEELRRRLLEGAEAGSLLKLAIPRESMRGGTGVRPGHAAGSSLDFHDYREYQPGDDLRHLDWSVYARSDREIIKLFREEVLPRFDIIIDDSVSMRLPGTPKAESALFLAGALDAAAANSHCSRSAWSAGGGESMFSDDANEIPRLFAMDTFLVSGSTMQTNAVFPMFTRAPARVSDTLPAEAPALGGYNLCYLHPSASAAAVSTDENSAPLLALRNAGTGRTAAFAGEADGKLSGDFAEWEHIGEFYSAIARYCAGPKRDASSGFYIRQRKTPAGVEITAFADPDKPELRAVDSLELKVLRHRTGPPVRNSAARLTWKTADSLGAALQLSGSETLLATVIFPDGRTETLPPVCLPYSAEFNPEDGRGGASCLRSLAESTGGVQAVDMRGVWNRIPSGRRAVEIASWLYLLAAFMFLAEVFERRTAFFAMLMSERPASASAAGPDGADDARKKKKRGKTGRGGKPSAAPEEPVQAEKTDSGEESAFARAKRRAGTS